MKLIDADALRDVVVDTWMRHANNGISIMCSDLTYILDAAPSIDCAADNPHGLVPSKCPTCGEELVPASCMDLAQDSYRDGILYGQGHPEWGIDG